MQYCTVCAVLVILSVEAYVMSQKFCGDNLTKILSQYCLSYNTPGHRVRRQIIEDCCHNYCSIQYLLSNYCERYNNEALERYLEGKNEIRKEKVLENRNIQETSAESYLRRMDLVPAQVRGYSTRYSHSGHVEHVHNSHWNSSSQHSRLSHDRKRRKTKMFHNKNKSSKKRNTWVPEPKLGQIEDSQKPFYVFKPYNR